VHERRGRLLRSPHAFVHCSRDFVTIVLDNPDLD
jgi:hypothetical protein